MSIRIHLFTASDFCQHPIESPSHGYELKATVDLFNAVGQLISGRMWSGGTRYRRSDTNNGFNNNGFNNNGFNNDGFTVTESQHGWDEQDEVPRAQGHKVQGLSPIKRRFTQSHQRIGLHQQRRHENPNVGLHR